jgi:RNA polymerase sigma-70 factor (ECF subfamily)
MTAPWDAEAEAALVARCRAGDDAAWAEVYRGQGPTVAAFLRRLNGPAADIDELLQQVFVELFATLGRFRGEARLSTWLYRIAANVSAKAERSSGRHRRRLAAWANALAARSLAAPDVGAQVEARSELARLDVVLGRLKHIHRAVWVLSEVEGQSLEAIAEALGIGQGTVRSRLTKARRLVTAALAQRGGAAVAVALHGGSQGATR